MHPGFYSDVLQNSISSGKFLQQLLSLFNVGCVELYAFTYMQFIYSLLLESAWSIIEFFGSSYS